MSAAPGPKDLGLEWRRESKHMRHLQAAVCACVCVYERVCSMGEEPRWSPCSVQGVGVWSRVVAVVVLGGGKKRDREEAGVDLQSEHNQASVFIRLVVCESRNKCV